MNEIAIYINNLHKKYDQTVYAVQGIDLSIRKGEFYGLLGPNGAGKSTTINAITSLVRPTEGNIKVFDRDIVSDFRYARALAHNPEILILDEPTAGVDVALRHDLWNFLQELHKEGKTILLTTHYIDEAELLCERVGIINNGKLVAEDTVSNLKVSTNKSKLEDVFLELTGRKLDD